MEKQSPAFFCFFSNLPELGDSRPGSGLVLLLDGVVSSAV